MPDFIDDLVAGRGPLGFLQDDYEIVDRVREAIEAEGAAGVLGLSEPVLSILRSIVTAVVGLITIIFLTYFMLLEGPRTIERVLGLLPDSTRVRYERVGREIYRTISGYVSGNLLISLIAGTVSAAVLFGVGSEYAVALGLVVAVFDLIPLAGATLAAIIVSTVVFVETDWIRTLIVIGFFIGYQQFENHVLQPLVYGRTVQMSPLAVLCAVLIGAELAGVLGALVRDPDRGHPARDRAGAARVPARGGDRDAARGEYCARGAGRVDGRRPGFVLVRLEAVVRVAVRAAARAVVRAELVAVRLVGAARPPRGSGRS